MQVTSQLGSIVGLLFREGNLGQEYFLQACRVADCALWCEASLDFHHLVFYNLMTSLGIET